MSKLLARVVLVAVLALAGANAAAQETEEEKAREAEAERTFAGLKFGVGLSATVDTGSTDRISDAVIDKEGIVRAKKKENAFARIMLETHYFWAPQPRLGHGPFVAVQPGESEIINAIGFGWMVGFRRAETNDSFNIGFGFVLDPNTKVLAGGFEEDKPAPKGETEIRYLTRDQGGILLLSSFSW